MNNSKKLQVTITYSIKTLRSRQPCNIYMVSNLLVHRLKFKTVFLAK